MCASCHVCLHLCYFSAIRCNGCASPRVQCLGHRHEELCACPAFDKFIEQRHAKSSLEWVLSELGKLAGAGARADADEF